MFFNVTFLKINYLWSIKRFHHFNLRIKKEREREREKQDIVRYSDMHANCLSLETCYRIYFIQTFPLKIDYIEPSSHFQYLHTTIQTYFFISSCKLENKISSILKKKKKENISQDSHFNQILQQLSTKVTFIKFFTNSIKKNFRIYFAKNF